MPRAQLTSVSLVCPGFLHCGSLVESGEGCGVFAMPEADNDRKEHTGMQKTGGEQARMRMQMLRCADTFLEDADNISVSRHTRVEACFESIYIRLLVSARGAAEPEPKQHPSERVIAAGAATAGLDNESLDEVLELNRAVADYRHKPGTDPVNMLHALTLARRIAQLVKA
jgi:hypothetical protein